MSTSLMIRNPFTAMDEAFDNMDNMWMQLFNTPMSTFKKLKDTGISVIDRPHNIYSIKDSNGKVIGNKLEVVTTPFKKDEVSVEIRNGVLHVECYKSDEKNPDTEELYTEELSAFECELHHGISSQRYSFSLKLSEKVDTEAIEAKNEDGILTIKMPFLPEIKEAEVKKITVL